MGSAIQPQPFGKYFLLEKIATGGMAEIYKAMYRAGGAGDFEKTLVIKRILPHLANDDEFVTMFRDEAKLTVRLNHANIVQVFDFGRLGTDHFLAMEYVQGQNLRQVMRRCQELGSTVPIPFALYVAMEICKGLQYAHTRKDDNDVSMGIIHRDVTPSNILVSYEGEVKIADFGIAKAAARAGGTQAGMIKGKASYLSPEQVKGKDVIDHRSDVFALGAVLWELLVGKKLFTGENDFEIMNRVLETPIRPPSEVNGTVPPVIDKIVMMALDRDRSKRYPNAASLQKDLSRMLAEFGGSVTSHDISNFLHRLFKKEMEAEKEASKSLRRAVLDEAAIEKAAREGATLNKPDPQQPALRDTERRAAATPPGRAGKVLLAIATLSVLALVGVVGLAMGRGWDLVSSTTPTPLAAASATPPLSVPVEPMDTPNFLPVMPETPTPRPVLSPRTTQVAVRPTPTPGAIPAKTPAVTATPAAISTKTPVVPAAKAFGVLKVDSQPWGEIFVDGKSTGRQTPAFDLKLPVGKHKIRLVNDVQKLEASFEVEIVEGAPVKKVVKLAPAS